MSRKVMGSIGRRRVKLSNHGGAMVLHPWLRRSIRASYDSAQTTRNNERHWQYTDSLSADAANSHGVRKTIRERARYEVANNSYARGIVETLVNDVIGTGPRLSLLIGNEDRAKRIEERWLMWSHSINLPEKLRTLKKSKTVDGEGFALLVTNPDSNGNMLDVRPIECDRITSPLMGSMDPNDIDGVILDENGYVIRYLMQRTHPGSQGWIPALEYATVYPQSMVHWFRTDRPEQHRGISEIVAALPLFGMLRRYTLAVVDAAETAANQSGIIKSDAPEDIEIDDLEPMDPVELDRNVFTTLPAGWDLEQLKSEQPVTTYGEFKKEVLNEIARCLNMPRNIAAADSSDYNYASGRLDHQTYDRAIAVERNDLQVEILNKVFAAWWQEETLAVGGRESIPPHSYLWDSRPHVDPVKEANAKVKELASGLTTFAIEYAKKGVDWRKALEQRAKEIELANDLGVPTGEEEKNGGAQASMMEQIMEAVEEKVQEAQKAGKI